MKLFSWIAGIALVIAGLFFLKYSVDHGWLVPALRMAIGLIVGAGLLAACEMKVARAYRVTADAMDGAGIALLFATFFAAHVFWDLIGTGVAFGFMALVTAIAVALSLRRDSLFIALLGLVGGFATPAALSTGVDRPFGLFGYLLLLNGALAWIAWRKRWPWLSMLALAFTTIYQWGWVAKFLIPDKLPIAVGIFLIFSLLALVTLHLAARRDEEDGAITLLARTASLASVLPLAFGVFMAATPAYAARFELVFGFLLLLGAGLAAVSVGRRQGLLHLVGAIATLLTWAAWLAASEHRHGTLAAWPAVLGLLALFALLYVLTPLAVERWGGRLDSAHELAGLAAPALLFVLPVLVVIEDRAASVPATFGTLMVVVAGITALAVRQGRSSPYHLAAFFTLMTEATWTARFLSVERLPTALALFVGIGLFHLAVPLVARAVGRPLAQDAGATSDARLRRAPLAIGLALAAHVFLLVVAAQSDLIVSPGPLLCALAILDIAIAAACLMLRRGLLLVGALAASHVVLLACLVAADRSDIAPIVLAAAAGVGALGFVTSSLARRAKESSPADGPVNDWFAGAAATGLLLAMAVATACGFAPEAPSTASLVLAQAAFVAGLLRIAAVGQVPAVSVVTAAFTFVVLFSWRIRFLPAERWWEMLGLGVVLHAAFIANPLLLGRRVGKSLLPHAAAVVSSGVLLWFGRQALLQGGWESIVGLLPVGEALLLGGLLVALLRLEPPAERQLGRLALVAGAALACVTVAIPMQLEKQWITVAWALETAALAWLHRRIPHRGLVTWCAALGAAVLVRLTMNPAVWAYHPRTEMPILNWYLYTYLVSAAALFAAAWFSRETDARLGAGLPALGPLLSAAGTLLLFWLLNIEIADYFSEGPTLTFNFSAGLAQDLTYTLGWAIFAILLLVAGILAKSRPARMASTVLLVLTVLKAFLHDLLRLGGLYRVASFVGLAACLALVAVVFQRFVLRRTEET